jgi:DNA-binding winged helix-turn-helix (wHTH) protein
MESLWRPRSRSSIRFSSWGRNQGQVLTKDELFQGIWPGAFVEEVSLAVNVFTLRKLLSENP